jgi:hypothetical protein
MSQKKRQVIASSALRKSPPAFAQRHPPVGGIGTGEFSEMNRLLQRLDRFWNDSIAYRL